MSNLTELKVEELHLVAGGWKCAPPKKSDPGVSVRVTITVQDIGNSNGDNVSVGVGNDNGIATS